MVRGVVWHDDLIILGDTHLLVELLHFIASFGSTFDHYPFPHPTSMFIPSWARYLYRHYKNNKTTIKRCDYRLVLSGERTIVIVRECLKGSTPLLPNVSPSCKGMFCSTIWHDWTMIFPKFSIMKSLASPTDMSLANAWSNQQGKARIKIWNNTYGLTRNWTYACIAQKPVSPFPGCRECSLSQDLPVCSVFFPQWQQRASLRVDTGQ